MAQTAGLATDLLTTIRNGNGAYVDQAGVLQSAGPNLLRLTYEMNTGVALGAIVEGRMRNLLLGVEALKTSPWVATASETAGIDDPRGGTAAFRRTVPAGVDSAKYQTITVDPSTVYTFSEYVRLGTLAAADFKLGFYDNIAGQFFVSNVAPTETLRTDKYVRIRYALTTPAGCTSMRVYTMRNTSAAQAGGTVDIAFPQIVQGSVAGSYIPTTTTQTATREADLVTMPLTSVPYSPAMDVLVIEARTPFGPDIQTLLQLDDGTEANRIRIISDALSILRAIITAAGVEQANLSLGALANGADFKLALSLQANNFAASLNGGAVVSDTSGAMPSVTTLRLGQSTLGEHWNSTIRRIKGLARPAANAAELQGL